jgi:hypothetical protein
MSNKLATVEDTFPLVNRLILVGQTEKFSVMSLLDERLAGAPGQPFIDVLDIRSV